LGGSMIVGDMFVGGKCVNLMASLGEMSFS
jgi:hypothetical protein